MTATAATTNTRCWCNIPLVAQTAYMDQKDRLNPGRPYYRCGNFGRGATCSFFAWVQTTTTITTQPSQQPLCAQPQQQTQPRGSQSPRQLRTPEKERRVVSALTVALKTRIKLSNEPEMARVPQAIDGELEALFGKKKKRRRTRSSTPNGHSRKLTNPENTVKDDTTSSPESDASPSSESEGFQSPYYTSSSPLSIPKVRNLEQRRLMFDKLTELDRKQQLMNKPKETKRPSTYPLENHQSTTSRRACYSNCNVDEDDFLELDEDDFFSFPLPSLKSPSDLMFHQHFLSDRPDPFASPRYEERG